MREPCRSCARREIDFGGCRCQAMALAGDPREADPACHLSPHHASVTEALRDVAPDDAPYVYRRMVPRKVDA
jgi:pyrroloquinoline quinone biosynthesis protein E